jgi:hypothetical protein
MQWTKPKRTIDLETGAPFIWNDTVEVAGYIVPARYTPTAATFLHPSRVPLDLLRELNPDHPYIPKAQEDRHGC